MLLSSIAGQENWQNHTAKLHLFHSPTGRKDREINLAVAANDPTRPITLVGRPDIREAMPGYRTEFGSWKRAVFDIAPGEVIKVHGHKIGAFGSQKRYANLFIAMREGAAHRRIKMPLSTDQRASYSLVYVEGKFDLLSYEQAAEMGCPVLPQFKAYSDPDTYRRLFTLEVVAPEETPRPMFDNRSVRVGGETVVVPIARRSRAMQV